MGINISVTGFDPESEEDLAWLEGEMEKILEATPEIEAMETKLADAAAVDSELDTLVDKLSTATDTIAMIPAAVEAEEETAEGTEGAEGDAATGETAEAGSETAEGDAAAEGTEEAPAEGEAAAEDTTALAKKAAKASAHLKKVLADHQKRVMNAMGKTANKVEAKPVQQPAAPMQEVVKAPEAKPV